MRKEIYTFVSSTTGAVKFEIGGVEDRGKETS